MGGESERTDVVTVFDEALKPVPLLALVSVGIHNQVYIASNAREEGNVDGKRLPSQGPAVSIPEARDLEADHQRVLVQ
jgi:hypothetical protein